MDLSSSLGTTSGKDGCQKILNYNLTGLKFSISQIHTRYTSTWRVAVRALVPPITVTKTGKFWSWWPNLAQCGPWNFRIHRQILDDFVAGWTDCYGLLSELELLIYELYQPKHSDPINDCQDVLQGTELGELSSPEHRSVCTSISKACLCATWSGEDVCVQCTSSGPKPLRPMICTWTA